MIRNVRLSRRGEIALPKAVVEEMGLVAGDRFEVLIEDADTIVLRLVAGEPNQGLVDLLLACPFTFDVPDREAD